MQYIVSNVVRLIAIKILFDPVTSASTHALIITTAFNYEAYDAIKIHHQSYFFPSYKKLFIVVERQLKYSETWRSVLYFPMGAILVLN